MEEIVKNKFLFQIGTFILWTFIIYLGRYGLTSYELNERNIGLFVPIERKQQ